MPENTSTTYEQFPLYIPLMATLQSLGIYLLGAYVLLGFGVLVALLYLVYCAIMEFFILQRSCKHCYYYGKVCGLGKGRLSALFFKKGNPEHFHTRQVHWYHLLPDFLTFIIPLIGGVISLYLIFSWIILVAMICILLLSVLGNFVIRGFFACKYCKQRQLGCPAQQLFDKKKSTETH